MGSLVEEFPV